MLAKTRLNAVDVEILLDDRAAKSFADGASLGERVEIAVDRLTRDLEALGELRDFHGAVAVQEIDDVRLAFRCLRHR